MLKTDIIRWQVILKKKFFKNIKMQSPRSRVMNSIGFAPKLNDRPCQELNPRNANSRNGASEATNTSVLKRDNGAEDRCLNESKNLIVMPSRSIQNVARKPSFVRQAQAYEQYIEHCGTNLVSRSSVASI